MIVLSFVAPVEALLNALFALLPNLPALFSMFLKDRLTLSLALKAVETAKSGIIYPFF